MEDKRFPLKLISEPLQEGVFRTENVQVYVSFSTWNPGYLQSIVNYTGKHRVYMNIKKRFLECTRIMNIDNTSDRNRYKSSKQYLIPALRNIVEKDGNNYIESTNIEHKSYFNDIHVSVAIGFAEKNRDYFIVNAVPNTYEKADSSAIHIEKYELNEYRSVDQTIIYLNKFKTVTDTVLIKIVDIDDIGMNKPLITIILRDYFISNEKQFYELLKIYRKQGGFIEDNKWTLVGDSYDDWVMA